MPIILGTPIISDKIVSLIHDIVLPPNTPPIRSIELRNKKEDIIHGNWGKFYPDEYRVTLCVPRTIEELVARRPYTRKEVYFRNKLDFFSDVLGHELYHAYQWTNHQDLYHNKEWLEVEAERYEEVARAKWNKWLEANPNFKYEDVVREEPVRYRRHKI